MKTSQEKKKKVNRVSPSSYDFYSCVVNWTYLRSVTFPSSQSENVGSRVDIRADDNKPPDQYRITNSFFIPILLALGRPYIEAVNWNHYIK